MTRGISSAGCLLALSCLVAAASGQAPPAVTYDTPNSGFHVPEGGHLTYALTGSQSAYLGYNGATVVASAGDDAYATMLGGTLGILTASESHPFSLLYGGGVSINLGTYGHSFYYQSLDVSQELQTAHWVLLADNAFRITPDIPLGGLSGTAGAGDLGLGTAGGSGAGLLTPDQTRIGETVTGSASRLLTGSTSTITEVSYNLIEVPSHGYATNSNSVSGQGGLRHRIDGRNEITGAYNYMRLSQPSTGSMIEAQSATATYSRSFTPLTSIVAGGGPQHVLSHFAGVVTPAWTYTAQASLQHQARFSQLTLGFDRSLRNTPDAGAGAETLRADINYSRALSAKLHVGASAAYLRTEALAGASTSTYSANGVYGALQVNRSLGQHWSSYVSYTWQRQIIQGVIVGLTPLQGTQQTVGFGITFAPLPALLRGH